MNPTTRRGVAALVLCLLPAIATADTLSGRVVAVTDGDTIKVLDADNQQEKIRLSDIDTPDSGTANGIQYP